jgi:SAM-dependent methyltransferase
MTTTMEHFKAVGMVAQNYVPPDFITNPAIQATEQQWKDLFADNPCWSDYHLRDTYISNVGFSILTEELVDCMAFQLDGFAVLDVGCGSGYITQALLKRGIFVKGVDNRVTQYLSHKEGFKPCCEAVEAKNALDINLSNYKAVIMSWPDYDEGFAADIARSMYKGQLLYYCGEWRGGCTANDEFFEILAKDFLNCSSMSTQLNRHHLRFNGIHDEWYVCERQ